MKQITYIYPEESIGKTVHAEYLDGDTSYTLFTDGSLVQRIVFRNFIDSTTAKIEDPDILHILGIITSEERDEMLAQLDKEEEDAKRSSDTQQLYKLAKTLGYVVVKEECS